MKLYHGTLILPGLILFLIAVTFPMWYGVASGKRSFESPPNPNGEACIESKEYMRANHMQLLAKWRDDVVRRGERVHLSELDGKPYEKSLTGTCMACHGQADAEGKSTSAATYCLDCHEYVGVTTYCWDCHIDPAAPPAEGTGA